LDMVSGWSARCTSKSPMSCRTDLSMKDTHQPEGKQAILSNYRWTDITYLLHQAGVSWGYYVAPGAEPDCSDDAMFCNPGRQSAGTAEIWNPLPGFATVKADKQLGNVQAAQNYFTDAQNGTLPAVSWIVPNSKTSEHPPASVAAGQAWVTKLVNAAMTGPDWSSTAIFLTWDDWG